MRSVQRDQGTNRVDSSMGRVPLTCDVDGGVTCDVDNVFSVGRGDGEREVEREEWGGGAWRLP